jgi:hypothetical protein
VAARAIGPALETLSPAGALAARQPLARFRRKYCDAGEVIFRPRRQQAYRE